MIRILSTAALCGALVMPAGAQTVSGGAASFQRLFTTGQSSQNGADLTEDTLTTCAYTVAAGQLANVGDKIHIVLAGLFIGSTDTKTVRFKTAGANAITIAATTAPSVTWRLEYDLLKTASNAQMSTGVSFANNLVATTNGGAKVLTDTATIVLSVTGQNTTNSVAGSVTCSYMTVDFMPAGGLVQ